MTAEIVDLDSHRRPEDVGYNLVRADRTINVLGSTYTIRTMRGTTGRGWFSVRDANDQMMFVRMLGFPENLIGDLIMAWVDGRSVGRRDVANTATWTKRPPGGHRV